MAGRDDRRPQAWWRVLPLPRPGWAWIRRVVPRGPAPTLVEAACRISRDTLTQGLTGP